MLELALRISCRSILSQCWGCIVGEETLDMEVVDFAKFGSSPYAKYEERRARPVPHSIAHQIDISILLTLKKYQARLLKALKRKISQKDPKPWYEIFLTIHVFLSNLRYIHVGAVKYMKSQMRTVILSSVCACQAEDLG